MKRFLFITTLVVSTSLASYFYLFNNLTSVNDASQPARLSGHQSVDGAIGTADISREPDLDVLDNSAQPQLETQATTTTLVDRKAIEIYGTIVDEKNQPIENALVSEEYRYRSTRSDADGEYQLEVELAKFKEPALRVLRAGYREKRVGIDKEALKSGKAIKRDIILVEASDSTSLQGWIGNANGEGLVAQKIRITSRGGLSLGNIFYVVFSDEKGDFAFEGIKSGLSYRLEVFPAGQYTEYVQDIVEVTQHTPRLEVVLDSIHLVDVRGMVISIAGVPVPGFEVNVKNITTNSPVRTVTSDSSGFFFLDRFPAGEIQFSTRAPEYFKVTGVTLEQNETRSLSLKVDKGIHYLSGWVSDNHGIPLEGARVTLDAEFEEGVTSSFSYRTRITNSTGSFNFSDLGDTPHVITVYAKGFVRKEIEHGFESAMGEMQIVMSASE